MLFNGDKWYSKNVRIMFFYFNIYGEYTVMEQDSNDEVLYVQDTSRSSRNSGGGV